MPVYTSVPSPAELGLPDKFGEFRPQQPPAILHLANNEKRFGILSAPTATGKSLIYMSLPRLMSKRALVLVGTKGLMDQVMREFGGRDPHGRLTTDVRGQTNYRCIALDKGGQLQGYGLPGSSCEVGPCHAKVPCSHLRDRSCLYYGAIDTASKAQIVVSNYAFWLALSRNQDPNLIGKFDLLVLDECFPPNTYVGDRRIADIRVGDFVPSFDPETGVSVQGVVTATMTSKPKRLLRLHYGERSVVCTHGHPIFTPRGWVRAGDLSVADTVLCSPYGIDKISTAGGNALHLVQDAPGDYRGEETTQVQIDREGVLLPTLREGIQRFPSTPPDGPGDATGSLCAHAQEQPDEVGASPREDEDNAQSDGVETIGPRGQWAPSASSGSPASGPTRLEDGVRDPPGGAETGLPNLLQSGYRTASTTSGDRGGRRVTRLTREEGPGSQERPRLVATRLDRIEVLEPGSDGTFGGLCPDGLVYNLEVAEHSTYIAEGLAVHNCHAARDWLAGFCEVEIDYAIVAKHTPLRIPDVNDGIAAWASWADASSVYVKAAISEVEVEVGSQSKEVRHLNELTRLLQALTSIADAGKWLSSTQSEKNVRVPGRSVDWVAERTKHGAKWSPLWGYPYAERYLFRGIPKIVLSSATITPGARKYLAISKEDSDFYEVPATISPLRRPLIYIPTVRLSAKTTTPDDLKRWVARIDEIIEGRLDRKGIIHARSYDRVRFILENSRFKKYLLTHADSRDLQRVVEYYKSAKAPVVLVSPSLEEGFDFPGDLCRYQVIVKVPFIDTRSPLARRRDQSDKSYGLDVTATAIMQMVGRAVRSEDDRAEAFIIDDQWNWFRYREAERFPESFRAAFRQEQRVPRAMSLTGSLSPFAR